MVDHIEKRVYEMINPFNPRSWLTLKVKPLTEDTSLNHTMKMDAEEAQDLLDEIFSEFGLKHSDMDFSVYFPMHNPENAKPLTINMLIESARAGRWLYD